MARAGSGIIAETKKAMEKMGTIAGSIQNTRDVEKMTDGKMFHVEHRYDAVEFNLKEEREKAGMTAAELARKAGLSTGAISQIENYNRRLIRLDTALVIADALHTTIYKMIGREIETDQELRLRRELVKARHQLARINAIAKD